MEPLVKLAFDAMHSATPIHLLPGQLLQLLLKLPLSLP